MGDHPQFGKQKQLGVGDFTKIPNGMPGVEPRMELIHHGGVGAGRFSMNRFVEIMCTAPAKMFGMFPKKGTIAIGSDADIVLWDPTATKTLSVNNQHMAVDYSCYEGLEITGIVETVLSKGKVIIADGQYHGSAGDGEYIRRGTSQMLV